MEKIYRSGYIGALMDELERAARELAAVVASISDEAYSRVRDTATKDEDCRSIATIISHVINSGYGYAGYFRRAFGTEHVDRTREPVAHPDVARKLDEMVAYMDETVADKRELTEEEAAAIEIRSRWGPVYDFEQLFEHAIMHLHRHRRQIERFLGV